jgi:hypothetical protein
LTDRNQADEAEKDKTDAEIIAARKAAAPAYQLWITCKKCLDRSSHTISKQAYHFGTCVVQCPKCKSQHLISDNLKVSRSRHMLRLLARHTYPFLDLLRHQHYDGGYRERARSTIEEGPIGR